MRYEFFLPVLAATGVGHFGVALARHAVEPLDGWQTLIRLSPYWARELAEN